MALYEYLAPVTPEQAEQYKKYVRALQTRSSYNYSVFDQNDFVVDYDECLLLGRPYLNSLITLFGGKPDEDFLTVATRLVQYGQPVLLDERVGGLLLNAAEEDSQREWLHKNAGQIVVLINDNEF